MLRGRARDGGTTVSQLNTAMTKIVTREKRERSNLTTKRNRIEWGGKIRISCSNIKDMEI